MLLINYVKDCGKQIVMTSNVVGQLFKTVKTVSTHPVGESVSSVSQRVQG